MSSSTKYSDIGTHSDPTTVPLKYSDIGTHSDPTTVPLKSSTVNTTFGDFLESSEGTQDRTFTDMTSTVSTAFGDFLESSEGTQDRTFTDMTSTVSTTFGDFLDSSAGTQDRTFTDMSPIHRTLIPERAEMNPYVTVQTGSSATHDDLAGVFVFAGFSLLIVLLILFVIFRHMFGKRGTYYTHEPKETEDPKQELFDSSDEDL
ncbi:uncharacterized protein LOC132838509 isoform X4 [Tachysurus vachellii]|uniref:uncharacterized protein LOC132838509 isoform X4 n=1 Tax=Tachysurus vachellii TaxID=175792 RepID=UPI00296AC51A|nr:uncharacterized protein LOC132838509 isoform X4 [Tachysurus vachellii]